MNGDFFHLETRAAQLEVLWISWFSGYQVACVNVREREQLAGVQALVGSVIEADER